MGYRVRRSCSPAVAASVKHWQELKEQGKLEEEPEEEDIYAEARMDVVMLMS